MYTTDQYEGLLAETVMLQGFHGDWINAYFARPLGPGPFPGSLASILSQSAQFLPLLGWAFPENAPFPMLGMPNI